LNQLSPTEKKRLRDGLTAAYSIPFIDDVEDFVWEAIFAHVRQIPIDDPLIEIRNKRLFDLVDKKRKIGWSAKALQTNVRPGGEFELVIQRADILSKKKQEMYRLPSLSLESGPSLLGKALMTHWLKGKIQKDMDDQGVNDPRLCILLKSEDKTRFTYVEQRLEILKPSQLKWRWTDTNRQGLLGFTNDQLKYRWYPNQKQLFEVFKIPKNAYVLELQPRRLPIKKTIALLLSELRDLPC
jgi:hypothetical protein